MWRPWMLSAFWFDALIVGIAIVLLLFLSPIATLIILGAYLLWRGKKIKKK